jgi:hypothetical protein
VLSFSRVVGVSTVSTVALVCCVCCCYVGVVVPSVLLFRVVGSGSSCLLLVVVELLPLLLL